MLNPPKRPPYHLIQSYLSSSTQAEISKIRELKDSFEREILDLKITPDLEGQNKRRAELFSHIDRLFRFTLGAPINYWSRTSTKQTLGGIIRDAFGAARPRALKIPKNSFRPIAKSQSNTPSELRGLDNLFKETFRELRIFVEDINKVDSDVIKSLQEITEGSLTRLQTEFSKLNNPEINFEKFVADFNRILGNNLKLVYKAIFKNHAS